MKMIASVCFILASYFAVPATAAEPENATLVQLIADPQKFDGKLIQVIGFLRLEFEGMHYVLLEGVFDSKERGHLGMWSGSLTRIRRAELWPFDNSKKKISPG
jgi:hypothetical protein